MFNRTHITHYLTEQLPELIAIYAFGSQIKQTARADSDLDLAILTNGTIQTLHLWQLANLLADQLNSDVDLIDLRAASTVMQYQLISTGELLYAKAAQMDLFRCFVFSEKLDLDQSRQKTLKRIQQEGRVYAR